MLRHKLYVLHRAVCRLGSSRASRPALPWLPRRNSPAVCSQRRDFAHATRPLIAASRTFSRALVTDVEAHTVCDTNGASEPATAGAPTLTFQEAITALEQYWAKESGANCAILLPHNTEVRGANSYHIGLRSCTGLCKESVATLTVSYGGLRVSGRQHNVRPCRHHIVFIYRLVPER